MRNTLVVLAGACLAASSSAIPFVVDDFSSITPQSVSQVGLGASSTWAGGGAMLGGSRGLIAAVTTSLYNLASSINIVPGVGAVSDNAGNAGSFVLGYFTTGAAPGALLYSNATDYDMTGVDGFEFDMISSDKGFTIRVELYSDAGVETWGKAFGPIGAPTTIGVGVADYMSGTTDMANIDALAIWFDTDIDGDLSMKEIRAVPEPATLGVLGVGALAMMRRRKQA